jgi:hypothetical protein
VPPPPLLLLPAHLHGCTHWGLVVADTRARTLTFWDSRMAEHLCRVTGTATDTGAEQPTQRSAITGVRAAVSPHGVLTTPETAAATAARRERSHWARQLPRNLRSGGLAALFYGVFSWICELAACASGDGGGGEHDRRSGPMASTAALRVGVAARGAASLAGDPAKNTPVGPLRPLGCCARWPSWMRPLDWRWIVAEQGPQQPSGNLDDCGVVVLALARHLAASSSSSSSSSGSVAAFAFDFRPEAVAALRRSIRRQLVGTAPKGPADGGGGGDDGKPRETTAATTTTTTRRSGGQGASRKRPRSDPSPKAGGGGGGGGGGNIAEPASPKVRPTKHPRGRR